MKKQVDEIQEVEGKEAQRIWKSVVNVMKSHGICLHRHYCDSLNYNSLSDSSLDMILLQLKLNQWKAFSGLDNGTAAGLSAINNLIELVEGERKKFSKM